MFRMGIEGGIMTIKLDPFAELAMYLEGLQLRRKWDALPRLVVLDDLLDEMQKEYFRMKAFILQRSEEAFQSAVIDPGMWRMEAEAEGVCGVSLEEYKEDWIEQWLEGSE
jgi:hypothetical protein